MKSLAIAFKKKISRFGRRALSKQIKFKNCFEVYVADMALFLLLHSKQIKFKNCFEGVVRPNLNGTVLRAQGLRAVLRALHARSSWALKTARTDSDLSLKVYSCGRSDLSIELRNKRPF